MQTMNEDEIVQVDRIPAHEAGRDYDVIVNTYADGSRTVINCPYIPDFLTDPNGPYKDFNPTSIFGSKEVNPMKTWYKPILKEHEFLKDVHIVYDTDFHDGPLTGHAWHKGRYCYFDTDTMDEDWDDPRVYNLYHMTRLETMIQLAERCLFQDIVGYHNTSEIIVTGKHTTDLPSTAFWQDDYIKNVRVDRKINVNRDALTFIGKFV